MNVMREKLTQRSRQWKTKLRQKNCPIFNTFRTGTQPQTIQRQISSCESNFSINETIANVERGRLLATAERTSSSSNLTVPSTSHIFSTPCSALRRQEPRITDTFLAESFQTPRQNKSSTDRTSVTPSGSTLKRNLQCLPPPNSFSSGKKTRCTSSSGPHPFTTPSSNRTPRTPRSGISFDSSDHYVIVAVTEGRGIARGEVGLAAIDMKHPYLILCQISDSQTYINTLMKMNILNTNEVLVPNTFVEGQTSTKLFTLINESFPSVTITTVQRRHFSDSTGLSQVNCLCLPEYSSVELVVSRKFYALSAAAALLKYVEFVKNVIFAPKSLKIVCQSAADIMNIDVETAQRLELVLSRSGNNTNGSLFGILNHCSTLSGSRFLRANILQPPSSLQQIEKRLDCVTELVQNPALLHSLQNTLIKFKDVEQLLWLCVQTPNFKDDQTAAESQINFILLLKTTMDNIPVLKDCLQDSQTNYFHKVLEDLNDEKFKIILNSINEVINEDARVIKGYAASQIQRCYAVKPGINGLLDVARRSHSDIINSISDSVRTIAEEFELPFKVSNTGNKGFHLNLNLSQNKLFNIKDLPPMFIQVNRSKNLITCTTEELVVKNQRIKLALKEVQMISNSIIFHLIKNLRNHISCLYRLCENIAELDIIISFAQVSSSDNYVRPTFGNELNLTASRHPILDFINPSSPIPNDVFASSAKNFHVITGPNMGGKSICIRQIALLQIMAQVGCYVPAISAEFRITDWLFSRIGFDDSIEHNASSFMLEMEEMQYISRNIGRNSLVIIDELGRSTSTEEGTAIAWAFCEHLLQFTAFTFFTTHFLFLTRLQDLYINVTNHYMKAEEKMEGVDCRLIYTYKLYPGVNQVAHYGLKLAQITSLPQSILTLAANMTDKLVLQQKPPAIVEFTNIEDKMFDVVDKWINLKRSRKLTFKEMKEMQLRTIGSELQIEQDKTSKRNNEQGSIEEQIGVDEQDGTVETVGNTEEAATEEEANTEEQTITDEQIDNDIQMDNDVCSDESSFILQLENSENSEGTYKSVETEENVFSQVQENSNGIEVTLSPVLNRIPLYTDMEFIMETTDNVSSRNLEI